jgi:hypothetical protein
MTRKFTGLMIASAAVPLVLVALPGSASADTGTVITTGGGTTSITFTCTHPVDSGLTAVAVVTVAGASGTGTNEQDVKSVAITPSDSDTSNNSTVSSVELQLNSNTYDSLSGSTFGPVIYQSPMRGGANGSATKFAVSENHVGAVSFTVHWTNGGTNHDAEVLECAALLPTPS